MVYTCFPAVHVLYMIIELILQPTVNPNCKTIKSQKETIDLH